MKFLKSLFLFHSLVTFIAGIVLMVNPSFIPHLAGQALSPEGYLVARLLAAAEFSISFFSLCGALTQHSSLQKIISMSAIIFHFFSLVPESLSYMQQPVITLLINIIARVIIIGLFASAILFLKKRN
ncbi:MAG: hypothetical protein ABIT96_02480 [Ferruginibacter sp.]